jgi:hypothetical protein
MSINYFNINGITSDKLVSTNSPYNPKLSDLTSIISGTVPADGNAINMRLPYVLDKNTPIKIGSSIADTKLCGSDKCTTDNTCCALLKSNISVPTIELDNPNNPTTYTVNFIVTDLFSIPTNEHVADTAYPSFRLSGSNGAIEQVINLDDHIMKVGGVEVTDKTDKFTRNGNIQFVIYNSKLDFTPINFTVSTTMSYIVYNGDLYLGPTPTKEYGLKSINFLRPNQQLSGGLKNNLYCAVNSDGTDIQNIIGWTANKHNTPVYKSVTIRDWNNTTGMKFELMSNFYKPSFNGASLPQKYWLLTSEGYVNNSTATTGGVLSGTGGEQLYNLSFKPNISEDVDVPSLSGIEISLTAPAADSTHVEGNKLSSHVLDYVSNSFTTIITKDGVNWNTPNPNIANWTASTHWQNILNTTHIELNTEKLDKDDHVGIVYNGAILVTFKDPVKNIQYTKKPFLQSYVSGGLQPPDAVIYNNQYSTLDMEYLVAAKGGFANSNAGKVWKLYRRFYTDQSGNETLPIIQGDKKYTQVKNDEIATGTNSTGTGIPHTHLLIKKAGQSESISTPTGTTWTNNVIIETNVISDTDVVV